MPKINWFQRSIQFKLTVWFLLILVPLVVVSLISNYSSRAILKRQVSERMVASIDSAVNYLELIMQNIEEMSFSVSADKIINEVLDGMTPELSSASIYQLRTVHQQFASIVSVNRLLKDIVVLKGETGTGLSWDKGVVHFAGADEQLWYREAVQANGGMIAYVPQFDSDAATIAAIPDTATGATAAVSPAIETPVATNAKPDAPSAPGSATQAAGTDAESYWKKDWIYFIRLMNPYNPQRQTNDLVIIGIHRSSVLDIVLPLVPSPDAQIRLSFKGATVWGDLPDSRDGDISSSDSGINGSNADINGIISGNDSGKPRLLTFESRLPASAWKLTIRQPEREILAPSNKIQSYTYAITIVSVLLALLVSLLVYGSIAKPLSGLAKQMKLFSTGHLRAAVSHKRQDELGYVMNTFNDMVVQHKKLIEEDYEKELRLAKSEFQLLQSQINPHFLYNTLDCIYTVSEEHGVQEISEMTMNLAMFFRVSLGKGGRETFTVAETVEHLRYYIRVQQIRLMDRFELQVDIEEQARGIPLLKLLLQPLVENAIVHGLERTSTGGLLAIRIAIEEEKLRIEIEDTGVGMEAERLRELRQALDRIQAGRLKLAVREEGVAEKFFALKNVKSRLCLYYGPDASFAIDSEAGRGTKVVIAVPVAEAEKAG